MKKAMSLMLKKNSSKYVNILDVMVMQWFALSPQKVPGSIPEQTIGTCMGSLHVLPMTM